MSMLTKLGWLNTLCSARGNATTESVACQKWNPRVANVWICICQMKLGTWGTQVDLRSGNSEHWNLVYGGEFSLSEIKSCGLADSFGTFRACGEGSSLRKICIIILY